MQGGGRLIELEMCEKEETRGSSQQYVAGAKVRAGAFPDRGGGAGAGGGRDKHRFTHLVSVVEEISAFK